MGPEPSLTPELVRAQSFSSSSSGYDEGEVQTFLERVAAELAGWRRRAEDLESARKAAEDRLARLLETHAAIRRSLENASAELSRAGDSARAELARPEDTARAELTRAGDTARAESSAGREGPAEEEPARPGAEEEPARPGAEEEPARPGADEEPARPGAEEEPARPGADEERPPEPADGGRPQEAVADTRVSDADESLLQRRESAVLDLELNLTRRFKRALQDEQNCVLDRLRNLEGDATVEAVLPAPSEQMACYADAARPLLRQAAASGVVFAAWLCADGDASSGTDTGDTTLAAPPVEDLAAEAATSIAEPLRRRLEEAIVRGVGDERQVLTESLGAAYREWKTQRLERIAGDAVSAAFSRGSWVAAPETAVLRWVVDDTDGPCPDCDDDALAGELPKGEPFPTGQHHPPAHSGCRCLLVPGLASR